MSRVLWWDCSVACAGDMLLASLIDAGARLERVREGLDALGLEGLALRTAEVERGAFRACRLVVTVDGAEPDAGAGPEDGGHDHDHDHGHDHGHGHGHGHGHDHRHDHDHGHGHTHRPWRAIRERIEGAALPQRVRERALAAYGRLAAAEAALHGVPVDEVELHEVGATDAIADVVGVCLALEDLGVDRIVATPLPMGTGSVRSAHGRIPLPAPATLAVLRGWPVVAAAWPGEWVTPTGAALVAALAEPGGVPSITIEAVGHGAGRRDPSQVANLVRAVVGTSGAAAADEVEELAANLDDTTGELVGALVARLLEEGALDAWVVPATMKKGRPGLVVHALCRPDGADALAELLLRHSSSLGVRRHRSRRTILERWTETVSTAYGEVRVKVGGRDGIAWHAAPEHADVAACARHAHVPEQEVWQAAITAWRTR